MPFITERLLMGRKESNKKKRGEPGRVAHRVPTRQGKDREICFDFKVREKSGNSVKWSGKLENLLKSGKSQGILKSCLVNPSKIEQTDMR